MKVDLQEGSHSASLHLPAAATAAWSAGVAATSTAARVRAFENRRAVWALRANASTEGAPARYAVADPATMLCSRRAFAFGARWCRLRWR